MDEVSKGNLEKIGARIREIRVQKHMSQQELATRADISLPQISEIERGHSLMRLTTFMRITEALEVSADLLLRINVPGVNEIYYGEIADILSDCTPNEMDAIIKIIKEVKSTLRQQSNNDM